MSEIEYFYSAHSVFAYIGSARFMQIAKATGRKIVHKPVFLNQVVAAAYPDGFTKRSKAHRAYYFGREIERWAEYRQVPIKIGVPGNHFHDTTLVNSMLIAGVEQGHNIDLLAHKLLEAHWLHHCDLADASALADIADSVGFDGAALLEGAQSKAVKSIYAANTDEAIERSVFGSPTYVVDGDMFYGQDRLELVERAIGQNFKQDWP